MISEFESFQARSGEVSDAMESKCKPGSMGAELYYRATNFHLKGRHTYPEHFEKLWLTGHTRSRSTKYELLSRWPFLP